MALMMLGTGLAFYCIHDAGTGGAQVLLAVMIFVAAVGTGAVIMMDFERREAQRAASRRFREVPPPIELDMVWPPQGEARRERLQRPPATGEGPGSKGRTRRRSSRKP